MTKEAKTKEKLPIVMRSWLEEGRADLTASLPDYIEPQRFITVALSAVSQRPELAQCEPASVYQAIFESARAGLMPDNREAAIIPYNVKVNGQWRKLAKLVPMIEGVINQIKRSPGIKRVESAVVYEGDDFDYQVFPPKIEHRPARDPRRSEKEIIYAYAVFYYDDGDTRFEVVDQGEIAKAREASKASDSPAYKNWPEEMARKFVVKRGAKYEDLSPEARHAIELDHLATGAAPMGAPMLGGPSDEYRGQFVRAATEDRIDALKNKLNGEDEEDEEDEEEKAAEPDEDKAAKPDEDKTYTREDAARAAAEEEERPRDPRDVPGYKLRAQIKSDPVSVQSTEFYGYVRRMGIDKDEAKGVLDECGERYGDALLALLNEYEELEVSDMLTDEQLEEREQLLGDDTDEDDEAEADE